ncbi:MAG TPA: hypothetical protein GYA07_10250 [Verrucomicrobia bacterium]|mgnify:CR=1 FL=1|nr:hypothetical protein [Verrucomicrobiota bacterium]HOQ48174.1 hypothetical protein [Bryobacteraceae bacterium]HPU57274.1 hypothetical protein [Verrucomicrobiota bacterium]
MTRRHVIISGTGRAGTTFLVQLFTVLGLDTGYSDPQAKVFARSNAGMEWNIQRDDAPYIVKSPELCERLEEALQNPEIVVEHALVPMRDLFSAAESRRAVARKGSPKFLVPRGLLRIRKPDEQETVLAHRLYSLMYTLARHDIPLTLLFFPRFVNDPEYLYGKVRFLIPDTSYETFKKGFDAVSRPDMVHDFKKA